MKKFLILLFGLNCFADENFKFEAHGFLTTTAYYQTTPGLLLNGSGFLLAQNNKKADTLGFDIRQSRLSLQASGPTLFGGTQPQVYGEIDFFGTNSPGGYGEVNVIPRLRLIYLEFNWDKLMLRIGQDWQLLNAMVPTSLAHTAFPFYGSGYIAWREPGISGFYTLDSNSSKLELAAQLLKSDWENPYAFGLSTQNNKNVDAGQLSGLPGIEARVKWTNPNSRLFLVGHYNRVALTRTTELPYVSNTDTITKTSPLRDFDVVAFKIGGAFQKGDLTLKTEFYYGKNLAPLLGNLIQFEIEKDIHEVGGWLQLGYNFNERWSGIATVSTSQPNLDDVADLNSTSTLQSRLKNNVEAILFQYKEGNFVAGPEIFFIHTQFVSSKVDNTQATMTGRYNF